MKVSIIGSGAMGLALASVLNDNNIEVSVYGRNQSEVDEINLHHTNNRYLNDVILNERIVATSDINESLRDSTHVLLAIPTRAVSEIINILNKNLDHKVTIINASKGLDMETKRTIQTLIFDSINLNLINGVVSLLGPGFAREIIKKNLTCICSVSNDGNLAKEIQKMFSNQYFRVYVLKDVIGAEICSSMKNAIAIASGICQGLGFGENTKSALITRGLKEIERIGLALGAKPRTFYGLTGIGDLLLTCNTFESRNFTFGFNVGKANDAKQVLDELNTTVEGIQTIKAIYEMNHEYNVSLPIINALYEVIFNLKEPLTTVKNLMLRPLKEE